MSESLNDEGNLTRAVLVSEPYLIVGLDILHLSGKLALMIPINDIDEQITEWRAKGKTAPFVQHLIMQIVDEVARSHYPDDYPMKCLQTAGAIQHILGKLNINSQLYAGAVCFTKIDPSGTFVGWTGFWGEDHHIWLHTEFNEIVDLSISQLHLHPLTRGEEMPLPAIWWDYRQGLPAIFKYLPDVPVAKIEMEEPDQSIYTKFLSRVDCLFDEYQSKRSPDDIFFERLLSHTGQLNEWTNAGDLWLNGSLEILNVEKPHPQWMIEREAEISSAYAKGEVPKSRLMSQTDLFRSS